MRNVTATGTGRVITGAACCMLAAQAAFGNGGPFIMKYPNGDPAAKGILARLDADLKPGREKQLKVIKEDLTISYGTGHGWFRAANDTTPIVQVDAEYTIKNPLDKEVKVDFGFPILRGIFVTGGMIARPAVNVSVDDKYVKADLISNSVIYGIIRAKAREVINKAIKKDKTLGEMREAIRTREKDEREDVKKALADFMVSEKKWNKREATLLSEYCGIDFKKNTVIHRDWSSWYPSADKDLQKIPYENLGLLASIGEKKATQMLALLAGKFDAKAASAYEEIFKAWGGDVRERSVDLDTGKVRPREVSVSQDSMKKGHGALFSLDPTVYARVDFLEKANLSEEDKASCKAILKNLPVIFTFAPMNLLHYQVTFAPGAEQKVKVSYKQQAYKDTKGTDSYQLAYVIHPASLWDEFGPINLTINVPEEVDMKASVACARDGSTEMHMLAGGKYQQVKYASYKGTVDDKTGELFVGMDAKAWNKLTAPKTKPKKIAKKAGLKL